MVTSLMDFQSRYYTRIWVYY